jgi:circadian clock protein KaiC
MIDQQAYSTGSAALDRVLGSGLPAASTTVLAGLPGTGKTVLAEQFLFANASEAAPAVYLTTLSEPLAKTIRYLQQFTFFDAERLPGVIHYQDIGQAVRAEGIEVLPRLIDNLIDERSARFVIIDSFKALHDLCRDPVDFRAALFDLGRVFTASGVTALLVGEYGPAEIASLPEFSVADGVIELTNRAHGVRDERTLRIHKLRGAAYLRGEHSFLINNTGLQVFPRLVGAGAERSGFSDERVATGIPGLDEILNGGLWRGSCTIVAGPTGVGKTMLGLRYLLEGARNGEPGVLVQFQESPAHLRRILAGFGIDQDALEQAGLLRILHVSPLELDLVQLYGEVKMLLESGSARRLVVDALGDLQEAAIERDRFRSMVWSLVRHINMTGVTGLLMTETPIQDQTLGWITQSEVSYMSDNILLLHYIRPPRDGFDRVLDVVKTRGSGHDPNPHPYKVGPAGPELLTGQKPS